jgi:AraC-like DNA-binding protein
MSICEYSMELRLQRARELLQTTYLSIKEIRVRSSIPNGPNFVREFKKRFRTTPSNYRQIFRRHFDEQIVTLTNTQSLRASDVFGSTALALKEDAPV